MTSLQPKYLVLHINLSTQCSWTETLQPEIMRQYLGGIGLASYLLYREMPVGADPLSPENVIVIAPGPFAGTPVPAGNKHALVTKSPLTGFIGDSLSSSHWSYALRKAGFTALVVHGSAECPTTIFIDNARVTFHDARHLWGLSPGETRDALRAEFSDAKIRVSSIGIAGERLVKFSGVDNDGRQAGRTGPGAVFGAKKLKAIALRGTGTVPVHDPDRLIILGRALGVRARGPATQKYRILGTVANVTSLNRMGLLPTRNFTQSTFEGAEQIGAEHLQGDEGQTAYKQIRTGCAGCPVQCEHMYVVKEGPHKGSKGSSEYESVYALGSCCGISDMATVLSATALCDQYGLDTISTGVVIAWAMECFHRGIFTLEDTGGLELRFGNGAAQLEMIRCIAEREGLGDLLAEGVKKAAAQVGRGSEHFAMHVKGLEMCGYDPRGLKTFALGLAVGTRGACHNRSGAYEVDLRGVVDRFTVEPGRGLLAKDQEDYAAVFDSMVLCKFIRGCFDDFYNEMAEFYEAAMGLPMSGADLKRSGERIWNIKKAFNIREGWQPSDDWLPPRLLEEPMADGVGQGIGITPEELRALLADYYQARDWTPDGYIPQATLKRLGLDGIDLKKQR